jgi:hypothetical protein
MTESQEHMNICEVCDHAISDCRFIEKDRMYKCCSELLISETRV